MAKILDRMKNVFKRNRGPQNLPPGSYPNPAANAETLGTITKPAYQTDDDDDDDDEGEDIESLKNYNIPEQTRLRGQPINTIQSNDIAPNRNAYGTPSTPRSELSNTPNNQFKGSSSGFLPDLPMNNNNNNISPPSNNNTAPDLPSRPGFPFLSQPQDPSSRPPLNSNPTSTNNPQPSFAGFPPGMNPNQPSPPPPPPNNPQQPFAGFPPGMNQKQSSSTNNPQPPFTGFPPGMNFNQTQPPPNNKSQSPLNQASPPPSNVQMNNPMNPQQGILSKRSPSFRNQLHNNQDDNVSRLELDYPIENVLVDANIPSAVAIKINDVVEQDRLGNAYHIHRYTFEPSQPQQISYGNNQPNVGSSFHGGTRHIREIHNGHQNPLLNDVSYSSKSNKHSRRRHHHYPETALDQYIDQLLHTPGSTVIQAQNYNDLQQILNQQLFPSQRYPIQPSVDPFQSNTNALNGPVFYYTARALYDDPMRNY